MPDTRDIVLVHRPVQSLEGCDPAIDLDAPDIAALLSAYQRTRSDEDRAKLPLKPGARPALFVIQRLPQSAMRFVMTGRNAVEQAQNAVLAGCHRFTDADGREHAAKTTGEAFALASESWLDTIGDEYGTAAVVEIGTAIVQWSNAGKRALAPFGFVPGLVLAR